MQREIAKQTGQAGIDGRKIVNDASVTFGWFVRNRFLPLKEGDWKEATAKRKKYLIQQHLIDAFDQIPLQQLSNFTLRVHINGLAKIVCRDTVLKVRASLRDILEEAVEQDFLLKNPARNIASM